MRFLVYMSSWRRQWTEEPTNRQEMKLLQVLALVFTCSRTVSSSDLSVTVFSTTSRSTILRWTRVDNAQSYRISVAKSSSPSSPVAFAMFGGNTVMGSVNSLSPNVLYTFTVEALGQNRTPLDSAQIQTSTAPPVMDPLTTMKSQDSRSLTLGFEPQTGASHYVVRISGPSGLLREEVVNSVPAVVQDLSPYTVYSLSIMAVNSGGQNQPSESITARTVLAPPQLSTSSPSSNSIHVSWQPVDPAVSYTVTLVHVGSNSEVKQNTSYTNITVSGLEAGALYTISAVSWDPEGREGEPSAFINQTTRPPTPSGINISVVQPHGGPAGLLVSWEHLEDLHGSVQYWVSSDQNLTCDSVDSDSCILSPLDCGQVHNIHVVASNPSGSSLPSVHDFISYPCSPDSLVLEDPVEDECALTWAPVPHAEIYVVVIKRSDGSEETCNTTDTNCTFTCGCGLTHLLSAYAQNDAGTSPAGPMLNFTKVPCCPEDVTISGVSADTIEVIWTAARGADLYETRAVDSFEVIVCNDTAPVCALSDLSCDQTYSFKVTPCNDISGCNRACPAHSRDTAPCSPTHLQLHHTSSGVSVSWNSTNRMANFTVIAKSDESTLTCTSDGDTCDINDLPCGSIYHVSVMATSGAGQSLPSFSELLETEPCCPQNLTVEQVTQAITNVTWSPARGADSFRVALTSSRGHARCHTQDSHCLMGCITCGTNYTVTMDAYSSSGRHADCVYQGFSSSACCPSGVRVYKNGGTSLRVLWRSSSSSSHMQVQMSSTSHNFSCSASPGGSSCDITGVQCGEVYTVLVAPVTAGGAVVPFCHHRLFSVTCSGSDVGTVSYRGKRSLNDSRISEDLSS
ncbi:fibronectin type III domain-containing protein 7-like [Synchiropus splendidus]|uniref:fibronectin type III domain-containing protein 7-like n=1 Tax=Synchiropus splendidus TaxID=270530 RepID=UPI00237DE1DA|nr:fibronectin type III domain-containing protein 7-like [Synchiropus splendidus]